MLILILLLLSIQNSILPTYASTYDTYFARVMYDDVFLYKTPVDISSYENVMFVIPKTYFVELTEDAGTDFYKANYLDFTGYVKKSEVQAIEGRPENPYLADMHFRVYNDLSRDLRSEPTTINGADSQIAYITLSRNLTFYGIIYGETKVEGRTNVWYYCKYTADTDYYGYVYSDFCDEFDYTDIPENTEDVTYIPYPEFGKVVEEAPISLPTESKTTTIVIAILCVPALIFVVMIIKSSKLVSKNKANQKEVKDFNSL